MLAGEGIEWSDRSRLARAVRNAELLSGLSFSLYVGECEGDSRAFAERLHAGLPAAERSVLVLCDPAHRALEIVTGSEARRTLTDSECALAAASMESSFLGGDLVGGLVAGVQQLGEAARVPRTLHNQQLI